MKGVFILALFGLCAILIEAVPSGRGSCNTDRDCRPTQATDEQCCEGVCHHGRGGCCGAGVGCWSYYSCCDNLGKPRCCSDNDNQICCSNGNGDGDRFNVCCPSSWRQCGDNGCENQPGRSDAPPKFISAIRKRS